MKKSGLILLFYFILIISITLASAIEIKPIKTEFSKGETFMASIEGNVISNIKKEDIGFYKNNAQLPFTTDIAKINNSYFLYAVLPHESINYTLIIKDVYYTEFNQYKKADLELNFSILNKTADFNVNPGLVISTKAFEISAYNNLNSALNLNYNLLGLNSTNINIPSQTQRKIQIPISDINFTQTTYLEISSPSQIYLIPVYIIKNSTKPITNNITMLDQEKVLFKQSSIYIQLNKDESYFDSLEVKNNGDEEVRDINISLSESLNDYLFIPQNKIVLLEAGESVEVNFTAKFTKTGNFSGYVYLSYNNESDILDLNFIIGEKIISNSSVQGKKSCEELNGKKCSSTQFCSGGANVNSLEGFCCLGTCTDFSSGSTTSNSNWWAIISAVIILGIIGAFLYFKYKKPKNSTDKILKSKEDDFSERFETSGKLSKI